MSDAASESCPFCGTHFFAEYDACPSCDLPLARSGAKRPLRQSPALFDGAALFDDAFPEHSTPATHAELVPRLQAPTGHGRLRCVVVAINQAEGEMLCEMLRSEGLPAMVRTPDLHSYAQGSQRCEVLVPEGVLPAARDLLRIEDEVFPAEPSGSFVAVILMLLVIGIAAALALLLTLAS